MPLDLFCWLVLLSGSGCGGHIKNVISSDPLHRVFSPGEKEIPGLTDSTVPRRLGPKRASKIRKLFNLAKEDDVRQYVVRRPVTKEGKPDTAAR